MVLRGRLLTPTDSPAIPCMPLAPRPALRGYLPLAGMVLAAAGLVVLLSLADTASSYVSSAVFGASLLLLFSTSTLYHIPDWSPRPRSLLRRADHAVIFLTIGGLYTPFCTQLLGRPAGLVLLCLVWGLAGLGILVAQVWPAAPKWVDLGLYCALGWVAIVVARPLGAVLPVYALVLLVLAGMVYSAGGVIYAFGHPKLSTRFFGHHELFHSFVILGSALIFAVVAVNVLPH